MDLGTKRRTHNMFGTRWGSALLGLALAVGGCDSLIPKVELPAVALPDAAIERPDTSGAPDGGGAGAQFGNVVGRVLRADTLAPLAGATITGPNGVTTKSDKDGRFKLTMLANERTALLAHVAGFAQAVEPVQVRETEDATLDFRLLAVTASAEVSADKGGEIRAKNGAEVKFEAAAFVDAEGKTVQGDVTVEMTVLDPSTPEGLQAFPGDFAATNKSGADGELESYVPMEITVKQGDKTLDFAPDKGAEVSFPVPKRLEDKAPPTIALWSLSETTGAWIEEGTATLITDGTGKLVYQARIRHMSWWNCDRFLDNVSCIRGCVTLDGKVAPGVRTQAEGIDYASLGEDRTDEDGCFSEDVKAGAQLRVRALADDAATEWKVITAPDTRMSAKDDPKACADVGTLELVTRKPEDAACPAGTSKCGDRCVDLGTDFDNCGSCDTSCFGQVRGSQCIDEACACAASETLCKGRSGEACTDLSVDEENCGACGTQCDVGQTCEAGACKRLACPDGLTLCGNSCVDAEDNSLHCGKCGVACDAGETCSAGQCEKLACREGSVMCGNECVAEGQCGSAMDCTQETVCPMSKLPINVCKICDGMRDCPDGADELNCGTSGGGTNCGPEMFGCPNSKECWPMGSWCDGTRDCSDGSDELNCAPVDACPSGAVRCPDGACAPTAAECSATICPSGWLLCADGKCAPSEKDCGPTLPTCLGDQMGCPNSDVCLPRAQWCDTMRDCPDGADELNCGGGTQCPVDAFVCPDGSCAPSEADCKVSISCDLGQMSCPDATGTPVCSMQCDGKPECEGGRDEDPRMCCDLARGMWCDDPKAPEAGTCIADANVCNAKLDCPTGQDEDLAFCCQRSGGFFCGGEQLCLSATQVCDTKPDCKDAADEGVAQCGCPSADQEPCRAGTEVTCVAIGTCDVVQPDCSSCLDVSCCALRECAGAPVCGGGPVQCQPPSQLCPDGKTCGSAAAPCPPPGGGQCPAPKLLCPDRVTCVDDPMQCPGGAPAPTCPAGMLFCAASKTCVDAVVGCPAG